MSAEVVRMPNGSTVLACLKPGARLSEEDKRILAEYVQFCRDRKAKKLKRERRQHS